MKDDKGNDNKTPTPDPVADMAALVNLSLKQRKKAWLDRADGYDWSEDSAEASAEQACRDAKALCLSRSSTVAKTKGESITLHCFLFGKLKPFYDSDLKAAQAVLAIEDETGLGVGEPVAKIEMPDICYLHHGQVFAHLTSENRYERIKESTVLKMAVMAGFSNDREANGQLSEAERCVLDITKTKGVDWDGALAGYPVGVHYIKGCKLLVSRSFDLIKPDPNAGAECPHIMALANGLYGDKAIHLHLWRKEAYESLFAGRKNTNMAFIVVGPSDSGKSLDVDFVTVPLLGGRKANAYAFLGSKTTFNDEQIGSEVHVIDDGNPFETTEARKQFANAIKQEVASNEAWCHPKGKAGFTVPLYRRLVILANPEDIALMPELNESMEDKLIMLEAKRFAMPKGCLPLPARTDLGAREAFVAQLRKELPAYINYLLMLEPSTKDFESRRWGVAAFKDENLVKQIEELSSTHEKHAVIQKTLFRSRDYRAESAAEVEINELYELLCDGEYKDRATKLFRNVRALGTALGHLGRKKDGYVRRESHGESLWHIERDAKFDEAVSVRPEE